MWELPQAMSTSREGSKGTMSDAVITQDILEDKSEKPVRRTSENIESELADH
jgi:hypothetical protein